MYGIKEMNERENERGERERERDYECVRLCNYAIMYIKYNMYYLLLTIYIVISKFIVALIVANPPPHTHTHIHTQTNHVPKIYM